MTLFKRLRNFVAPEAQAKRTGEELADAIEGLVHAAVEKATTSMELPGEVLAPHQPEKHYCGYASSSHRFGCDDEGVPFMIFNGESYPVNMDKDTRVTESMLRVTYHGNPGLIRWQ